MKNFCSPHVHIASFDAASTPEKFAKRELELGTGHITITDHGTLEGTRKVYDLCNSQQYKGKLTPILGLEGYFRDDDCPIFKAKGIEKDDKGTYRDYLKYMHITMHFQDQEAFEACSRVLSKADDKAEVHGSERKPLFTWNDLEELGQYNITFTSGCLIGMVSRHILQNKDLDSATKYYEKLRNIAPQKFFVEIFPHVCDRDYQVGVYFKYEDGTEEKFPVWKNIKTKQGEFKAEQIANEFKNNRTKADRHERIMEVMNYRKWEPVVGGKLIVGVEKREGFLKNECSPMCPNGDVQLTSNKILMELAEKYGDKILISDDSHFANPEEKVIQDIRLNQRELEKGLSASWVFPNSHHRFSTADAVSYFKANMPVPEAKIQEWVENSYEWADKFKNFKFKDRQSLPTKFYPKDTLKHTLDLIERQGRMDWNDPVIVERLKEEIELLHRNGKIDFLPYFFVDAEVVDWYLRHGELTGPGRGSAAGLRLAYDLGITHVNPLKWGLSKDRFMTPDRIKDGKFPDIDQDLPHRDLLVDPKDPNKGWLKERFGDCVAQISTESTLKLKSSIKDVFRALRGSVPDEVEAFCKSLPNPPQGINDRDFVFGYDANGTWEPGLIDTNPKLKQFSETYPKEWESVSQLMGLVRQRSRHASAFVISNEPISNFIPLTTVGGHKVTQFNHFGVEAMGGLKMDFLNVLVLKDIRDCIRMVQDRSNTNIDWKSARKYNDVPPSLIIDKVKVPYVRTVPHNGQFFDIWDLPPDTKVFNSIAEGDTESIFQFNCLDAETEALTQRGWVPGFSLTRDDVLLTKNPKSGILEWQKITDLKLFPEYEGDVVEFSSKTFSAITTPDHRWLADVGGTTKTVLSKEMGHGASIHRTGHYQAPYDSYISPDEAELLGWFVTDGHYEKHKKCNQSRVKNAGVYACITQSLKTNSLKCKKIDDLLKRLDVANEVSTRMGPHDCKIWRLGPKLTKLMLTLAPNRSLEAELLYLLSYEALVSLKESMVSGDGWKVKGLSRLCTGRKEQADAFQILLTLLGSCSKLAWVPQSKKQKPIYPSLTPPVSEGVWAVNEMQSKTTQPKKNNVTKKRMKIPVWCPMVPNTFFVARRRGQVWITGNTASAKGWLHYFNHVKFYDKDVNVKALDSIEALAAFTALDRPGPLDYYVTDKNGQQHNMLVEFANRARGAESVGGNYYLNEALPETHGIIVYQEQLEKMFRVLGKTTPGKAEEFRRAVAKKDVKKVLKFKEMFVQGATPELGEKLTEELWQMFETFGQYGFNKSHAICYVIIGYACAWLKYYYPLEWWCAVLKNADRKEIDEKFWQHCGHLIETPDVQSSQPEFCIVGNKIKAPLSLLHGIGDKAHEQLVKYAPYVDVNDFCQKIQQHMESGATTVESTKKDKNGAVVKVIKKKMGRSALNSRVVNTLIVSGAMDGLFPKTKEIDGNQVPLNPIDKIFIYRETLEKTVGKKLSKKEREELVSEFSSLSEIKQFQLKKKVLPAYTENVLPMVVRTCQGFSTDSDKDYCYKPIKSKGTIKVFGRLFLEFMENMDKANLMPKDGVYGGVLAYVVTDRRFTYGAVAKQTACELILDVEGKRIKLVRWPDSSDNLGSVFQNDLTGAIVVASLSKKEGKPISLRNLFVIETGIDTKKLEEESPEPEESKE